LVPCQRGPFQNQAMTLLRTRPRRRRNAWHIKLTWSRHEPLCRGEGTLRNCQVAWRSTIRSGVSSTRLRRGDRTIGRDASAAVDAAVAKDAETRVGRSARRNCLWATDETCVRVLRFTVQSLRWCDADHRRNSSARKLHGRFWTVSVSPVSCHLQAPSVRETAFQFDQF
jgi:hypothetical protein